jgi:hypothetical protein
MVYVYSHFLAVHVMVFGAQVAVSQIQIVNMKPAIEYSVNTKASRLNCLTND